MSRKLVKDKDCIKCKHFFECEGKPEIIDKRKTNLCLSYEEGKKDGRSAMDKTDCWNV